MLSLLAVFAYVLPPNAQSGSASNAAEISFVASQAQLLDLPDGERPVSVQAAFHLLSVHEIDDEAETFKFSGVLTLAWKDSRQAFDPKVEGVEEKYLHGAFQFNELSPGWYPQVVLVNATEFDDSQGVLLRTKPDGNITLVQTITAEARSRLDLHRYPYDKQCLEAVFEVLGFDDGEVVINANADAASADLSKIQVPQWDLTSVRAIRKDESRWNTVGQSSALVLTLEVSRQSFFMVRLVLLPLILIVLLSWSVFWMDRSSLGDRMSVSFVGILTAVAYQIMVSDIMPRISYVTLMNAILNFSFLVMCATVVINLKVGSMDKRGDYDRGERLDLRCRWLFPLVYTSLIAISAIIAFVWF